MVDIGGEVKVRGPGPKGDAWSIGVYVPTGFGQKGLKLPKIRLRDSSIATSGNTFKAGHLIDPVSKKSARTGLLSVSVVHPSNATADAFATALFVMGPDQGLKWAEAHQVRALFVLSDGSIRETN